MATLYRNTNFGHLLGGDEVEVLTGSLAACNAKAAELRAKGFTVRITGGTTAADWAEEVAAMDDAALKDELAEVYENGHAPDGWRDALDAEFRKRGF